MRSPYTEHAASGLPNPTHLEGEIRFGQAQDQQVVTTRSPRIVTECLFTRSILIKMYVYAIYSWFRIGTIFVYQKAWIWVYHYTNYRVWWVLSVLAVLCLVDPQHFRFETSFRPEDHTDWEMATTSYDFKSRFRINEWTLFLFYFYPIKHLKQLSQTNR